MSNLDYEDTVATMTISKDQPEPLSPPELPRLKLEMEAFSDLTTYCKRPQIKNVSPSLFDSQGDLNTPVFELEAPFDFDRLTNVDVKKSKIVLKNSTTKKHVEYEKLQDKENNIRIGDLNGGVASKFSSYCSSTLTRQGSDDNNSYLSHSPPVEESCTTILPPEFVDYVYVKKPTLLAPVKTEPQDSTHENNESCYFADTEDYVCSEGSNMITGNDIISSQANYPTPDSSRASSPALKLDFSQKFNNVDSLKTPNIIDAIDSFECEKDFNILNFINEEDLLNPQDLFPTTTTDVFQVEEEPIYSPPLLEDTPKETEYILSPDQTHNYALPPQEEPPPPAHRPRKNSGRKRRIKTEEDDDEDYVPPSKRKPISKYKTVCANKTKKILVDNEINGSILEELIKTNRRGRPPKSRLTSISSDSSEYLSLDSEGAKYREMRDKNNEASRRSRFKRKLKELAVEDEADDLAQRNIKLKAEVEELEKTVTTFRNNLMILLMKK